MFLLNFKTCLLGECTFMLNLLSKGDWLLGEPEVFENSQLVLLDKGMWSLSKRGRFLEGKLAQVLRCEVEYSLKG